MTWRERASGGRIVDPRWLGPKRAVTTGFDGGGGGGYAVVGREVVVRRKV